MIKKQHKRIQSPIYKGQSLITDQNIGNKIRQFIGGQQFYQVQLAQVRKIMTQQDIDDQKYPIHQHGAIQCRLLYTQQGKSSNQLITMIPRDPNFIQIPIVGQIVYVSKHPSVSINVTEGPIFDQYYYIGILNILNKQNNNAIIDVSSIDSQQQAAKQDQNKYGDNFYSNDEVQKISYEEGDVLISGRYGHTIKFTNNRGTQEKNMLPSIIISNENSQLFPQKEKQNPDKCGSLIELIKLQVQPKNMPTISSKRNLLNGINSFSLIGNNILNYSDRILFNARTNDIEFYAKQNIEISANNNIFMQSKNINLTAESIVTINVGDVNILVNSSGVTIKSPMITLDGKVNIPGIKPGSTPGFCLNPLCFFTGGGHTINIVG